MYSPFRVIQISTGALKTPCQQHFLKHFSNILYFTQYIKMIISTCKKKIKINNEIVLILLCAEFLTSKLHL